MLAINLLMKRKAYPSDLNNDEWELIKPLIPIHQGVGHPQTVDRARKAHSSPHLVTETLIVDTLA